MQNSLLIQVWTLPFMPSAEDGSEWLNRLCVLFSNEKKLRTFIDDNVSCWWIFSSKKLHNIKRGQPSLAWDFKWLMLVILSLSRNISTVCGFWRQQVKSRPNSATVPIWSRIQHTKVNSLSLIHFSLFENSIWMHLSCVRNKQRNIDLFKIWNRYRNIKWPLNLISLAASKRVFTSCVTLVKYSNSNLQNLSRRLIFVTISLQSITGTTGQEYLSINKHFSFFCTVSN